VRLTARILVLIPSLAIAAPLLGQRITVESADPASTVQGTTLNVTIRGRGFSAGATSKFLVTKTNDTGRVTVNHTSYINSTTLIANVTAADDAVISFYDIAVTASGRTGKGIEKFSVQRKSDETINPIVLELPEGCGTGHVFVRRLNNGADLASLRFPASFRPCGGLLHQWVGTSWETVELPPGLNGAFGSDVSDDGTLVGTASCWDANGASCAPTEAFFQRKGQPGEILPGAGYPSSSRQAVNITSDGTVIVGEGEEGALVWTWDDVSSEWLSDVLGPGASDSVSDDGNVVVGQVGGNDVPQARLWQRGRAGEPYTVVDFPVDTYTDDVTPSGRTIVGARYVEICGNRRCTKKTSRMIPVFWRRNPAGDWVATDLEPLQLSTGEPISCTAWGGSEIVGRDAVAVGVCGGTAVAWQADATGTFGAPIALPAGDGGFNARATAVNQRGWVLGVVGRVDGERPILWKLP